MNDALSCDCTSDTKRTFEALVQLCFKADPIFFYCSTFKGYLLLLITHPRSDVT